MNLHPIFVHFPIALLTIYALLELARFKKLSAWAPLFYIKATFVILGSLGTFAALLSGEAIEDQFEVGNLEALVETHANWAVATSWIFGIISIAYLVAWILRGEAFHRIIGHKLIAPFWRLLTQLSDILLKKNLVIVLAIIGLLTITITGALGGAIAYGPDIDPAAQFFYNLLVQ